MFEELQSSVKKLDEAVELAAKSEPLAARLMTHPGVGPITSLAFVLIIGPVERFDRSKQVVSYLGLNPQEHSPGRAAAADALGVLLGALLLQNGDGARPANPNDEHCDAIYEGDLAKCWAIPSKESQAARSSRRRYDIASA